MSHDGNSLQIRSAPKMRIVRDMNGQNSVRAYLATPESVCVQIRMETRFANANLSFDEAKEFARRILAAMGEST